MHCLGYFTRGEDSVLLHRLPQTANTAHLTMVPLLCPVCQSHAQLCSLKIILGLLWTDSVNPAYTSHLVPSPHSPPGAQGLSRDNLWWYTSGLQKLTTPIPLTQFSTLQTRAKMAYSDLTTSIPCSKFNYQESKSQHSPPLLSPLPRVPQTLTFIPQNSPDTYVRVSPAWKTLFQPPPSILLGSA